MNFENNSRKQQRRFSELGCKLMNSVGIILQQLCLIVDLFSLMGFLRQVFYCSLYIIDEFRRSCNISPYRAAMQFWTNPVGHLENDEISFQS